MFKKISALFMLGVLSLGWVLTSSANVMCPLDNLKPKQVRSLDALKSVAVLNQGRIKPFETFAKTFLLQLSGRDHYKKQSALEWMAKFLFAPRSTYNDKVFLVNHPEILEALKVKPVKNRKYSYNQLNAGYEKLEELARVISQIDDKKQSVVDKEILRVFSNVVLYSRLSGAFTFALAHPDFTLNSPETVKALGLPEGQTEFSYYDILNKSHVLAKLAHERSKLKDVAFSPLQKDTANLLSAMSFWEQHYAQCPFGLIPSLSVEDEQWMSPMDTILIGFQVPEYQEEIKHLRDAAVAYWNGEQLAFNAALRLYNESTVKRISAKERKAVSKIPMELFYNRFNGLFWAGMFYSLGLLVFLLSLFSEKPWMYRVMTVLTVIGFAAHLAALALRVIIMSRPPVSNLFETFVFVGAFCVFMGLILERINRSWIGLIVANVCGFIMLIIAGKFSNDGDTMQMLIAVLNSNFWLSTHVIAITIGYAGCCVAGIMGHIYVLQALSQPKNQKRLDNTYQNMLGVLGFGLMMSFLGTALGGVWADQSWGRFWGWDPKENGALMIVLWSAIVFHAKIAKVINPLGVAVGCILTLMVVMWAWFGVNLLSIGLHSYGFASGIAGSLILYVIAEIIFISVTVILLGRKGIKM